MNKEEKLQGHGLKGLAFDEDVLGCVTRRDWNCGTGSIRLLLQWANMERG